MPRQFHLLGLILSLGIVVRFHQFQSFSGHLVLGYHLFRVARRNATKLLQQILPLYLSNKAAIFRLSTDPADDPRLSG